MREIPYYRCPKCGRTQDGGGSSPGLYSWSSCSRCGLHWLNDPEGLRERCAAA